MNDVVFVGNFVFLFILYFDYGGSVMSSLVYCGWILYFFGDLVKFGDKVWEYFEDGLLWIEYGYVCVFDYVIYLLL